MTIQKSVISDLPKITSCHINAFPNALSSKLGKRFCNKMLSWYIISDRGTMFHAEENGFIVGYVGGIVGKQPGLPGAATSITQFSFSQFILSFLYRPWLIFHPENLNRYQFIFKNLKLKLGLIKKQKVQPATLQFSSRWGLVVIGVNPIYQGKGIGSELLKEFEQSAKNDGVKEVTLSVKKTNSQAISAYKKNGWKTNQEDNVSLTMHKTL